MRNLAIQVFEHKEIRTTLAKAKELRSYVERLITYGKKGTLHHRRLAFSFLQNKQAVTTLFDEIAPTYETRNGGYTRIIKLGNRKGDNAKISIFQLVGFEKVQSKEEKKKKKKAEEATTETKKVEEESKPVEETAKNEESKETEATAEVKEETVTEETKNEETTAKSETADEEAKEEKNEEKPSSEEK